MTAPGLEAPRAGLEPIATSEDCVLPEVARGDCGVRLPLRGRSVPLRRLRRPPSRPVRWLLILGPGLIASAAGNDAGGIATYSAAGAQYGYALLWVMLIVTVSLGTVQEMCARLGAATGRGLLDLIRERLGLGWALFAVGIVLLANGGLASSEFVGIGAAAELLGVSRWMAIPVAALGLWGLIVFGSYPRVERAFLLMTLVFFAYPVAAVLAHPSWPAVARGTFVPSLQRDPQYVFLLVGLIGTTITPYMQLFQQSSVVERGAARRHYGPERIDAWAGVIFSDLMSIFMIIATAATLHQAGITHIETAADAAKALEPLVGSAAEHLFGVGLLGASLLAAAILPLATAYAVCEAFGLPKGIALDLRSGVAFYGLFTGFIVFGAGVALVPGLPVMRWLVAVQVLNGALLPVMLFFVLRLAGDRQLMGDLANTRLHRLLGWGTLVLVSAALAMMFGGQLLAALGVHPAGGS